MMAAEETHKTQTMVTVEGRAVVILHSRPHNRQVMTPVQARLMAGALVQAAAVAEAGGN